LELARQHKPFGKPCPRASVYLMRIDARHLLRRRSRQPILSQQVSLLLRVSREGFMANFTPISAAIGGALIGLAAVLLMLLNGRIAGITGVFSGLIDPASTDRGWRATFMAGLIAAPLSAVPLGYAIPIPQMPANPLIIATAGLLVGFGTRLSNGCTSGHGICGIARLSARSITATALFMAAAIVVVAVIRHVIGG
jgi:uncharacterized protein